MGTATLAGHSAIRATVVLPRWGIGWGDVRVDTDETIEGTVVLEIAGLSLVVTVVDGGVYNASGWYRVVVGAGGWRKTIGPKAYRNDAGVKLSTVLQDAARECGETLGTIPKTTLIGPGFVRPEGEASRVLDLLAEEDWYVDEQGTTQIGVRAASEYDGEYTLIRPYPERQLITIAASDVSLLLPGAEIEGIEAASVRHELTPDGLRSHVWGYVDGDPMKSLVESFMRPHEYHRHYEYKVTKVSSGHLDLRPVRTSQKLPELANVAMRAGVPGGVGEPQMGASVLVGFIDGDPTRAFVCGYEGEAGAGWLPTKAKLDASSELKLGPSAVDVLVAEALGRILRHNDLVQLVVPCNAGGTTTYSGPLTPHPSLVAPGAPGAGYSKAKA